MTASKRAVLNNVRQLLFFPGRRDAASLRRMWVLDSLIHWIPKVFPFLLRTSTLSISVLQMRRPTLAHIKGSTAFGSRAFFEYRIGNQLSLGESVVWIVVIEVLVF